MTPCITLLPPKFPKSTSTTTFTIIVQNVLSDTYVLQYSMYVQKNACIPNYE